MTSARLEPDDWLVRLRTSGAERDDAERRLHALLVRAARAEANRRGPRFSITGPELDDLAEQAAADAFVAVVRKLDEFRGESKFTTWALKFVMFEVSTKLSRHFWVRSERHLDAEQWDALPSRFGMDPELASEWADLVAALHRAVDSELTARQRDVFVAIVVNAVPMDALVAELNTNRNAIYKTMFDARKKLRAALHAQGYLSSVESPEVVPS